MRSTCFVIRFGWFYVSLNHAVNTETLTMKQELITHLWNSHSPFHCCGGSTDSWEQAATCSVLKGLDGACRAPVHLCSQKDTFTDLKYSTPPSPKNIFLFLLLVLSSQFFLQTQHPSKDKRRRGPLRDRGIKARIRGFHDYNTLSW